MQTALFPSTVKRTPQRTWRESTCDHITVCENDLLRVYRALRLLSSLVVDLLCREPIQHPGSRMNAHFQCHLSRFRSRTFNTSIQRGLSLASKSSSDILDHVETCSRSCAVPCSRCWSRLPASCREAHRNGLQERPVRQCARASTNTAIDRASYVCLTPKLL